MKTLHKLGATTKVGTSLTRTYTSLIAASGHSLAMFKVCHVGTCISTLVSNQDQQKRTKRNRLAMEIRPLEALLTQQRGGRLISIRIHLESAGLTPNILDNYMHPIPCKIQIIFKGSECHLYHQSGCKNDESVLPLTKDFAKESENISDSSLDKQSIHDTHPFVFSLAHTPSQ